MGSCVLGLASTKLPSNPLTGIKDAAMGGRMYRFEHPEAYRDDKDKTGEYQLEGSVSSPFHLQALSVRKLRLSYHAHSMYWISGIAQTGDELLNELTAFLSVQKTLNERLRMGIMIVFQNEFSTVSTSKSWIYGGVIGQFVLSPKTDIGILILNPNGSKITSKSAGYPTSQSIFTGIEHRFSTDFSCSAEIGYETKSNPRLSVGCNYRMIEQLSLQGGLSLFPMRPSWGLSVSRERWGCQYAGNWHAVLGISSAVGLSYFW